MELRKQIEAIEKDGRLAVSNLNAKQIGEYDAREFLGEDTWKRWKIMYDEAMAYRKTLKGKPTDEQREQLAANSEWIDFCDRVLWHSAALANHNKCVCKSCDLHRKAKAQHA